MSPSAFSLLTLGLQIFQIMAQHEWEPRIRWEFDTGSWRHQGMCRMDEIGESPVRRHMPLSPDDKTIYVAETDVIVAVNTNNGKPSWAFQCKDCISTPSLVVAQDGEMLYAGTVNHEMNSMLYAIFATNGTEAWKAIFDETFTMCFLPTISSDGLHVYGVAQGRNGGVFAMHTQSGEMLWNYSTPTGRFKAYAALGDGEHEAYVRVHYRKDKVLKTAARDELHAFDTLSGSHLWLFAEADSPFVSTYAPVVTPDGGTVLVFTKMETLYALDAHTGVVKWTHHPKFRIWSVAFSPNGSTVYFGDSNGGVVHAVDLITRKQLWQFRTVWSAWSFIRSSLGLESSGGLSVSTCGQTLFVGNSRGYVFAIHTPTGKMIWFKDTPGKVRSIVSDHDEDTNVVFVLSNTNVYALSAHADHLLEHTDL